MIRLSVLRALGRIKINELNSDDEIISDQSHSSSISIPYSPHLLLLYPEHVGSRFLRNVHMYLPDRNVSVVGRDVRVGEASSSPSPPCVTRHASRVTESSAPD
jgi:hypothetical protein